MAPRGVARGRVHPPSLVHGRSISLWVRQCVCLTFAKAPTMKPDPVTLAELEGELADLIGGPAHSLPSSIGGPAHSLPSSIGAILRQGLDIDEMLEIASEQEDGGPMEAIKALLEGLRVRYAGDDMACAVLEAIERYHLPMLLAVEQH